MGITLILIGFFFLLNPNIVVIDVLPDFIGYILILLGIRKLAKINLTFADAFDNFRNLLILSLVRIPAMILFFQIAKDTDEVWGLAMTIGFAIFEILFAIRAYNPLFAGLRALGDTEEYESAAANNHAGEVKGITLIFMGIKAILAVLPELCTLSSKDYGTVTTTGIATLAGYRLMFTVTAAVLCLFVGIYWYLYIHRYFKNISKDNVYLEIIEKRYTREMTENRAYHDHKKIYTALLLLIIMAVFSLEFKFDGFNYLPHPVFAGILLFLIYYLYPIYPAICRKGRTSAIVYLAASAAVWVYSFLFIRSFYGVIMDADTLGNSMPVSDILNTFLIKRFDVVYKFTVYVIASAIDALLFIWLLLILRKLLHEIINDHTGGTFTPEGHLIGGDSVSENQRAIRRITDTAIIVGMISALSGILQAILLPYFPVYWIIDGLIRIAFIVLMIVSAEKIRESMKDRYDLS